MEIVEDSLFKKKLKEVFLESGINLTEEHINKFLLYYKLLIEWNNKFNLTTITSYDEVILKHFLDSAICFELFKENATVVDIGSGAGFPSIPLKILRPDLEVLLVDSVQKKVAFLQEVVSKLKLSNIKTIHSRIEDLAGKAEYRESFDYCVSRAVAPLNVLSEYSLPFVKKDGQMISYKSNKADEEILYGINAIKVLGGTMEKTKNYKVGSFERTIVLVKKISKTPNKYPRGGNKPRLSPII